MKTDFVNDTIDHITEDAIASGRAPLVSPGSVLVVVRSGILQHTVPIAVNTVKVSFNQDIRALTPKPDVPVIGDFVAAFLKCTQHKLLAQVKWSTTVQSINKKCIEMIGVPLPPLDIQHNLVNKVKSQRKTIAALKAEADQKSIQAEADVEAMILGIRPVEGI